MYSNGSNCLPHRPILFSFFSLFQHLSIGVLCVLCIFGVLCGDFILATFFSLSFSVHRICIGIRVWLALVKDNNLAENITTVDWNRLRGKLFCWFVTFYCSEFVNTGIITHSKYKQYIPKKKKKNKNEEEISKTTTENTTITSKCSCCAKFEFQLLNRKILFWFCCFMLIFSSSSLQYRLHLCVCFFFLSFF